MKLLFFISSLRSGGAERVLVLLTNELVLRGYDITIILLSNDSIFYDLNSLIKIERYNYVISSSFISKLKNKCNLLAFIRNRTKELSPDVIISFIYQTNTKVLLSTLFTGIPVIVSEHNTLDRKMSLSEKIQRFYISQLATRITILTEHDNKFLGKRLKKKVVMPNPLSFQPIDNFDVKREKSIVAIGSIKRFKHKGLDNLVTIWSKIADVYPDWKLKIVGDYDEKGLKELQDLEKKANINNRIEYLGLVKDVKSLLSTSSIFILSSRWEGLPMVLIEAMSQGCASISYDLVSGPNEIIINGENGILIDNQNMEKMVGGLQFLIDNEKERAKLGVNAVLSVSRFSVNIIVDKWEDLFKTI